MSKTIECPKCGGSMDVPAYPGDGVYRKHHCTVIKVECPYCHKPYAWYEVDQHGKHICA